jgi:hypothetical protein
VANDRDSSKQKRARQNRAQRAALEARTKSASAPRPSRQAPGAKPADKAGAAAATPRPRGGLFGAGRPRPDRPPRLGETPVDLDTLEGGFFKKRMAVPGGLQVLMGFALSVLITAMVSRLKFEPTDAKKKKEAAKTIFELLHGWAIPVLALPILVVGAAMVFTLSPHRRRIWLSCTIAMGAAAIALPGIYFNYVFVVGFLVYAMMRANKVEGPAPGSRADRVRRAMAGDDGSGSADADEPLDTTGSEA